MARSAGAAARIVAGVAVTVALAVGAWVYLDGRHGTAPDPVLAALQANAMAARSMPAARLVTAEDRSAQQSDPLTGKPRTTQVLRAFAPVVGQNLGTLQKALIERANSAGWAVSTAADDSTRGSITLAFGRADLVIAANPYTTPPTITVTLTPADPNL
jgi:hypothetical protein